MIRTCFDTLFPAVCPGCRKLAGADIFCDSCRGLLEPLGRFVCRVCGDPLPLRKEGSVCLKCCGSSPSYDTLRAAFHYGGPLRDAILSLKHTGRYEYGPRLGRLLVEQLNVHPFLECDVAAPVPLFRSRMMARGYNQAALLAAEVASSLHLPLARRLLERVRDTGSQQGLSARQRADNVAGAFAVRASADSVLLVDDVIASSATVSECSRMLKRAGVRTVHIWCLARSGG